MIYKRVEVEYLSGPEDYRDRRTFNNVTTLEFIQDSHLRIVSVDDGEMIVKWNRLQWYHTQPLSQLGSKVSFDEDVLNAGRDAQGRLVNKIMCIKRHRELTGWMLKESKDYCDALFAKEPNFPTQEPF